MTPPPPCARKGYIKNVCLRGFRHTSAAFFTRWMDVLVACSIVLNIFQITTLCQCLETFHFPWVSQYCVCFKMLCVASSHFQMLLSHPVTTTKTAFQVPDSALGHSVSSLYFFPASLWLGHMFGSHGNTHVLVPRWQLGNCGILPALIIFWANGFKEIFEGYTKN